MFDDQPTNTAGTPGNLPVEPEDIFENVEKETSAAPVSMPPAPPDALKAGLLKKKENTEVLPMPPVKPAENGQINNQSLTYSVKEPVLGKIIIIFVLGCAMAGLIWGGWFLYGKFGSKSGKNQNNNQTTPAPVNQKLIR